jgi:hypothetical protein
MTRHPSDYKGNETSGKLEFTDVDGIELNFYQIPSDFEKDAKDSK